MNRVWSDEMLNAYVDGELDTEEADRLRKQLDQDAQLQQRVDDLLTVKFMVQSSRYETVCGSIKPSRRCVPLKTAAMAASLLMLISAGLAIAWHKFEREPVRVAAGEAETRILMHFSSVSSEAADQLLDQAEILLRDYARRHEPMRLEVVENGYNLVMLRKNSLLAPRIRELIAQYPNVSFAACLTTKKNLEAMLGYSVELMPEADVVDSGVAEISNRQKEGWAYIRG